MLISKKTVKAREIAQSAKEVFGQKGYAFTSMEDIAAAAGVGKSTVYDYYKNKEELFISAIMTASEQWFDDLNAVTRSTSDPVERLRGVGDMYIESLSPKSSSGARLFVEVLSQTVLQGGVFYDQRHLIQNLYQRVVRLVMDFFLDGVSKGVLRPDIARNAEAMTINFLAFLDGLTMHSMVAGSHIDMGEQIDLYLTQLAEAVLARQAD